jgi:hypothetical protein
MFTRCPALSRICPRISPVPWKNVRATRHWSSTHSRAMSSAVTKNVYNSENSGSICPVQITPKLLALASVVPEGTFVPQVKFTLVSTRVVASAVKAVLL